MKILEKTKKIMLNVTVTHIPKNIADVVGFQLTARSKAIKLRAIQQPKPNINK